MPSLPNRFYDRIRHPAARSLAREQRTVSGFDHLKGHKDCLLVTYKRSGEPVPTPVWFGLADGKLYVRSDANADQGQAHPQRSAITCRAVHTARETARPTR